MTRSRARAWVGALLPLAVVCLALSACSGSGSSAGSPTATPITSTPNTAAGEELAERAAATVSPSVVRIDNPGRGLGSGIIMSRDGEIVTNDHVVADGSTFTVTFANGRTSSARLLGKDPLDDLAVVKANATDLPAATFGNSSELRVGQSVLAIGNPLGINFSVTEGIVSGLNRTVGQGQGQPPILNMVQTSAAINPGNSGGALIDLSGQVIGVPTLSAVDPSFGTPASGVGFAVSSNTVKRIVPQLIKDGRVVHSGRAAIGIAAETVTPELAAQYRLPAQQGVLVAQVSPDGPAARAGIQAGSIIIKIDGRTVTSAGDLSDVLAGKQPGENTAVTVIQPAGGRHTHHVTLRELPAGSG